MGAGKSTIGQVLANSLNLPFADSDYEIQSTTGADITWIFDVEGETGFRERETAIIKQLCKQSRLVLATGGGAVLCQDNCRVLCNFGTVIYLRTSVAKQLERVMYDKKRPLLQNPNPAKVLQDLLVIRDPIYRQMADIIIDTDNSNLTKIVSQILCKL